MKYTVAIAHRLDSGYPQAAPFDPAQQYPETSDGVSLDPSNGVYDIVRESFRLAGLDKENYGSSRWNPLGQLIRPGNTVFLKPNMIAHKHARNDDWDYVITHGSVVRAVIDYAYLALHGEGRIIVGDGPQTDSDFDKIVTLMGLPQIQALYKQTKGFEIEVLDLRDEYWVAKDGIYTEEIPLKGDPLGRVVVDLGKNSQFAEWDSRHRSYYGAYYDVKETNRHHQEGRHNYSIARTPIEADVFINIPKLKTHKKCGLTLNLKGMVGVACDKNWLPHYVLGAPCDGGDQFERLTWKHRMENALVLKGKRLLLEDSRLFKWLARGTKKAAYSVFGETDKVIRSGNWHGNDTVWRMCLDLNRILLFANPDGSMRESGPAKRFFSIVDGVSAMEGDGPVAGRRKGTGLIVAGDNPVAVDAVCARLMGFDPAKIPLIARGGEQHSYPLMQGSLDDMVPVSNNEAWNRPLRQWKAEDTFHFEPHFGWVGAVEMEL